MPATNSQRPHILWVVPRLPTPARSGGDGHIYNLISCLSRRYRISLMAPRTDEAGPEAPVSALEIYKTHLVARGDNVQFKRRPPLFGKEYYHPELAQALGHVLDHEKVDIVQFEFHDMGRYAHFIRQKNVPIILTEHDAGLFSWSRSYLRPLRQGRPGEKALAFARQWIEAAMMFRHCDRLVALSQMDARLLELLASPNKIRVVPLGVNLERFPFRDFSGRVGGGVIFVGHYPHYPNEDAAVFLCREIWPLLKEKCPGARLQLVGSSPGHRIAACAARSIDVVGPVPSLEPILAKARLFAVPVRLGMGMKTKILEAFASGVPVVAMRRACEGIPELRDGEHLLIAENAEQFAEKSARLLANDALSSRLARHARKLVEDHYQCGEQAGLLDQLYSELLRR